jgi:hypothetical protein
VVDKKNVVVALKHSGAEWHFPFWKLFLEARMKWATRGERIMQCWKGQSKKGFGL